MNGKDPHTIVGLHVTNRTKNAGLVQQVLTRHGEVIRTRLGLHDVHEPEGAARGLILLELMGPEAAAEALTRDLGAIEGVEVQHMRFPH